MKLYAAFLMFLLLILQYKFWFEEGGYFHNQALQQQLDTMREENRRLQERNRDLARQIILVKEDMNEIESLARRNLGMIKQDEKFIYIIDEQASELPPEEHSSGGLK